MTKNEVSVIIPNWNGENLLPNCLKSLHKQTFTNFEVIVADNGSTDNSVLFINKNYPKVKLICLDKNYGFSIAVNKAVEKINSDYFVLLNNDTEVDKNWLKYLVETIKNHKEVAAAASMILNYNNRNIIDNAGDAINIVGQPHPREKGSFINKSNSKAQYIMGVTGGASIYQRNIFLKLGKFDPDYFFYFEDVDFALRAQLAGYKFYFQPKAIVYHHSAKSAVKLGKYVEYLRYRNTIYLVVKNFPAAILLKRFRFIKITLVWLHTFYFFARHKMFIEAIMVWVALFWNLPKLLSKRLKIQKQRKVSIDYFDKLMEDKTLKVSIFKI